jgi:hypothetical protein
MKHIKRFIKFESVIVPDQIDSYANIRDYEDLKDYGDSHDFDVVEYDEFLRSLPNEDKTTAPPRHGNPFFALFHPINKKPMFVICDKMFIRMVPNFKEIVDDVISHERIHGEQSSRRGGLTFKLPNPREKKSYFSNKDEIMAFSWTIAQALAKDSDDIADAMRNLNKPAPPMPPMPPPGQGRMMPPPDMGRNMPPMPPPGGRGRMPEMPKIYLQIWNDIKSNCDESVINRYKKNIYNYLKELF